MSNPGQNMHRARELAKTHELHGFDYLDKHGKMGARGAKVVQVRLTFGLPNAKPGEEEFVLVLPHEADMLKGLKMKLRPVVPNA